MLFRIWFPYIVIIILPYHYLIFCFFCFFGLFDECLIFSLIDSIIFPITNMWLELIEVYATHSLSPIVSYGLNRQRYIFVFFFFFFFFFVCVCVCGYRLGLKFLTNKFQQTSNYALLAFYFYQPLKCGYLMFVIRIVFTNFTSF